MPVTKIESMVTNKDDVELMEKLVGKLAEFQFYTLAGFEKAEEEIKVTYANLRKQANQLKRSYKKGNFKLPLPSLVPISEEVGKENEVKNGLPHQTAEKKTSELASIVSQKKKTTRGRTRKRKSSNSPKGQPSKTRREESTENPQISAPSADFITNHVNSVATGSTCSDRNKDVKNNVIESENKTYTVTENENELQNEDNCKQKVSIEKKEVEPEENIKNSLRKTDIDTSFHKSDEKSVLTAVKRPYPADEEISPTESDGAAENQFVEAKIPKKNESKINDLRNQQPFDDDASSREKRCTRSKMAKPKPDGENASRNLQSNPEEVSSPKKDSQLKQVSRHEEVLPPEETSPNEEVLPPEETSPHEEVLPPKEPLPQVEVLPPKEPSPSERRCTRSKMAKPKPKPEVDIARNEPLSSEEVVSSPEKRCTRSKMAKPKPKTDADLDSSRDEHKEKAVSLRNQEGSLNPKQRMKVKDLKDVFSPGFRKIQEKENLLSSLYKSVERKPVGKETPLQVRNTFFVTPGSSKIPLVSSALKSKTTLGDSERRKKEEEARRKRQKEEEVLKKKLEMVKAKQEDVRRKNEEKMLKAAAAREAAEKEKSEYLMRMEKEREERERATKELLERKKEEEAIKKKMAHMTKAMEAEQRRLKEEAARQAKIKEMEEEHKLQEELRLKQQEETERIMKQRQEEMRVKEAAMKVMQKKKQNIIPLKDKDNLDINELELNDDEDDDDFGNNPAMKKELPEWARRKEDRLRQDRIHSLVPMDIILQYYAYPSQTPDLTELFGKVTIMKRVRSSSAVWLDTPPLHK